MARVLDVYLKGELVGKLEQHDSGTMSFAYAESWLESKSPVPLSASMPLRKEPFGRNECRPFFAGLLPEETSRKVIARGFGISDKNDFAILERIGAECAGAVSLMPPGEPPVTASPRYQEISLDELAAKFADLPAHPLLAGENGIRLSLAGAQGKLAVMIRDGSYFLPIGGSPSTHILKPANPYFKGLVENEFFCMRLAARAGLEVAPVAIGTAGAIPFLQVERFDRTRLPDGSLERIHQEDFCQALGIPPELKYQQEGGPNLKKCFALVRRISAVSGPDILRLFDAVVFSFLIGNSDAHGKNFSFLYHNGGARLAPLYDLVCTQAYPELSPDLAMKIGDERTPSRIFAKDWRKFFKAAEFGQSTAVQRIQSVASRILRETQAMLEKDIPGSKEISPLVLEKCHRLIALDWGKE